MTATVLDASAVIALLQQEPGAERVAAAMEDGFLISAVNFAEVATKLVERGVPRDAVHDLLSEFEPAVVDLDADLAYALVDLRLATRSVGLSLGDRACLALSRRLALPAVTADRSWQRLNIGVSVVPIR